MVYDSGTSTLKAVEEIDATEFVLTRNSEKI